MNTNDEVKTREKEYHDRVFKEGSDARDKALVYYSITSISNRYYLDYLETKIGKDKNLLEYCCGAGGDAEGVVARLIYSSLLLLP